MPFYVHWLERDDSGTPRYVLARPEPFDRPEEANAFATTLDQDRRPLVTASHEPPPLEEQDQSPDVS